LGSLQTLPDVPDIYKGWSPDSINFIVYDGSDRLFMGSVHGEVTPLGSGKLLGWIDTNHYLFYEGGIVGEVGSQERVNAVEILSGINYLGVNYLEPITFVFLK
jgi:hypothetical protein